MPYVNIQITTGASREQKAQLVREITDSLVRVLDKKPEHTSSFRRSRRKTGATPAC